VALAFSSYYSLATNEKTDIQIINSLISRANRL